MALGELDERFHQELSRALGLAQATPFHLHYRVVAFGSEWKGILTDWTALAGIIAWDRECREARLPWDHRQHLSKLEDHGGPAGSSSNLGRPPQAGQ